MQWFIPNKVVQGITSSETEVRVMGIQSILMHMGSEGQPVESSPTEELLQYKLLKKLMMPVIKRCQNIQCIATCCAAAT